MLRSSLTHRVSYGECICFELLEDPRVDHDPRRSEMFDSMMNFNGHVKAVSRALEQYKDAKPTAAAAEVPAPAGDA